MREYKEHADEEDVVITLEENDTTQSIREENYYFNDNACYWAKLTSEGVYYSRDDIFETDRLDATHLVAFLK